MVIKCAFMAHSLPTRGYGALLLWSVGLLRPERLPRGSIRPYERVGPEWILALLAVLFFAGTMLIEAIRLRG